MTAPTKVIEELYAMPLSAFTRERDARAAALQRAGDREAARSVRTLKKPTVMLWATNQLARAEPARLDRFVAGVERLRRSQLRDARATTEAMRAHRAELEALVERAEEVLTSAGFRASPETAREISSTLLGAAVDPERARDLRHGRLTQALSAPGFEVLVGAPAGRHLHLVSGAQTAREAEPAERRDEAPRRATAAPRRAAEKRQQAAERHRAAAEARQQAKAAREAAAEIERQRRRREAEERALRTAARRAEVERLEAEARRLSSALSDTRRRLRDERRLVKRAARP